MSNSLERWKSGDKKLQVVVEGFSEEDRSEVLSLFFQLGWDILCNNYDMFMEGSVFSNTYDEGVCLAELLLFGDEVSTSFPTTWVAELRNIVDYENSKKQGNINVSESNKVKEVIEKCFKDKNSYENLVEKEMYKLCSLLEEVGGNGELILSKLDDKPTTAFLDTLFRNGITFCKKDK